MRTPSFPGEVLLQQKYNKPRGSAASLAADTTHLPTIKKRAFTLTPKGSNREQVNSPLANLAEHLRALRPAQPAELRVAGRSQKRSQVPLGERRKAIAHCAMGALVSAPFRYQNQLRVETKNPDQDWPGLFGAPTRARTWDPLIKSQLLYQLSYQRTFPAILARRAGQ